MGQSMPSHKTCRFEDFVREVEDTATPEEREQLDAWRERFRRELGDDGAAGVREPVR